MTGVAETVPFGPGDVRRVRATLPDISERQTWQILRVARSTLHRPAAMKEASPKLAKALVKKLQPLIQEHPSDGYRQQWTLLRYREGVLVNRKAVYHALRIKQWLVHEEVRTPSGSVLAESFAREQSAVGDGCDAYSL